MLSCTAEYALRAIVHLATSPESHCTAAAIAEQTKVPGGYISKVLQDLAHQGIVLSQRGPNGGFLLARKPTEITLLQVINAVDPVQRITECPLNLPGHGKNLCPLHASIDAAAALIERHYGNITVEEMAQASRSGTRCLFPVAAPKR